MCHHHRCTSIFDTVCCRTICICILLTDDWEGLIANRHICIPISNIPVYNCWKVTATEVVTSWHILCGCSCPPLFQFAPTYWGHMPFLPARRSKRGNSYGNVSGWLGGWLVGWVSVTLRYCIKTAKPIWKLFRPSESPIALVAWDPCSDTKFHGEPLQRGVKYKGVGKLAIFVWFSMYIAVYLGNGAR